MSLSALKGWKTVGVVIMETEIITTVGHIQVVHQLKAQVEPGGP